MVTSLLLGRGLFRLSQYGAAVALLRIWGEQRYSHYAAALGAFLWLTAVTSVGTEKAALNLLARARKTHGAIRDVFLGVASVVSAPALALFAVAVATGWAEQATLYAGGAALAAGLGANGLLVGLLRVTGRPHRDVTNFVGLSVTYVGLTGAAGWGAMGPVTYVGAHLAVITGMNVAMMRGLGWPSLRGRARPALLRLVGRTVVLMGGSELSAHAAPSILFIELAMTRWAAQSGALYLSDLIWSAWLNLFFYLLRIYQPRTAARLVGAGARSGRARAGRLAVLAFRCSAGWLVGMGLMLAAFDWAAPPTGLGLMLMLGAMLLTRAPTFVLVNLSSYLLENGDHRSLRASAASSVSGLIALAVAGAILVPALGAIGAPVALGVMDLVQAAVLLRLTAQNEASDV